MIFAHKGYKSIGNTGERIPTDQWNSWIKLINDDQVYCKNLKYTKPIKKVNPNELPSWHPYWKKLTEDRSKAFKQEIKRKFLLCVKDPELIKVYFNLSTTLDDIKKMF